MSQPVPPHQRPAPHVHEFNRAVVEEFRANGGRVSGHGDDLLLLTTVGARSGREYTTPLGYVRDGDRLLLVASAGGSPRHPQWYQNLLAHPMVEVEVGAAIVTAVAIPAEGPERERLFARVVAEQPGYLDYQRRTSRTLPVVVLEPMVDAPAAESPTTMADKLLEIHAALRAQLQQVHHQARAYLADRPDWDHPSPLTLQLRQHCLAFCDSLRFHHTSEDLAILPDLLRQHPHLEAAVTRLRTEHQTVARIMDELAELLSDLGSADPDRFRRELDRLSGELAEHLAYEEQELIPVLAAIPFPPVAPEPSR